MWCGAWDNSCSLTICIVDMDDCVAILEFLCHPADQSLRALGCCVDGDKSPSCVRHFTVVSEDFCLFQIRRWGSPAHCAQVSSAPFAKVSNWVALRVKRVFSLQWPFSSRLLLNGSLQGSNRALVRTYLPTLQPLPRSLQVC